MSNSIISVFRIIIATAAAFAVAFALVATAKSDGARARSTARYVCPMHREVEAHEPSECPICRMALERVDADGEAAGARPMAASDLAIVSRHALPEDVDGIKALAVVGDDGVVIARLTDDDIEATASSQVAWFRPSRASKGERTAIGVQRTGDAAVRWDRDTWRVAFGRTRHDDELNAGDVGQVILTRRARDALVVPLSAILHAPEGPYVIGVSPDGRTFTERPVYTGATSSGLIVVRSGLAENDVVVKRNAFFADAERRLRAASVAPLAAGP